MRNTLLILLLASPIGLLAQNTSSTKTDAPYTTVGSTDGTVVKTVDAVPAKGTVQPGTKAVVKEAQAAGQEAPPQTHGPINVSIEVEAQPLIPGSEPPTVVRMAVPAGPSDGTPVRQEVEVQTEAQPALQQGGE